VAEVMPYFDDPTVGGVQVGVRINNRHGSRLARMQDMEFVIYTEVFQRGRRHLDSVGLGGNGQFMRLSALLSWGTRRGSRSLTEDLDLVSGCSPRAGGTSSARRQRCTSRASSSCRSWSGSAPGGSRGTCSRAGSSRPLLRSCRRAKLDLLYHLSSPSCCSSRRSWTASFLVSLLAALALALGGGNPLGWWVLTTYLLSFGPALAYSCVYWTREREHLSLPQCLGLAQSTSATA
jgi:hypothetical protein